MTSTMSWTLLLSIAATVAAQLLVACAIAYSTLLHRKRIQAETDRATLDTNMITAFNFMNDAFTSMHSTFANQQKALDNVVSWTVPPEEWSAVIELHHQIAELNGRGRLEYVLHCNQNGGYWRIGDHGYTPDVAYAKRFSPGAALLLVLDRARNASPNDCYTLVAVAKQEAEA